MAKARRHRTQAKPQFSRMSRVNELVREILADELELLEDERLELVTITHVEVDRDLKRALVLFACLGEGEDEAAEGLEECRRRLQGAIARQARLRSTPELRFKVDTVIDYGAHIEQLLSDNPIPERPELDLSLYDIDDPDGV